MVILKGPVASVFTPKPTKSVANLGAACQRAQPSGCVKLPPW